MKTENKYSILIWAIVVLVIMNVTTIITVVYHKFQFDKIVSSTVDAKQAEIESERFSGRYFRDELNMSNAQMEKFKVINPVFRPKAKFITIELAEKRKQMLVEMATAKSDTSRLNALSDSIGQLHSELKRVTYRYYLEMKAICNPEQQVKLEKLFGEMFTNDLPLGSSGKGGPRGWQGGRQFGN